MVIVGIDYSMSSPGICIFDSSSGQMTPNNCRFYYLTRLPKLVCKISDNITGLRISDTWLSDIHRFDEIGRVSIGTIQNLVRPKIFLEGYSMGSRGKIFQIGENTGILKHMLMKMDIPITLVPPTSLKKFATSKGNADKAKMVETFKQKTGVDLLPLFYPKVKSLGSPITDLVDAFFLCNYGYEMELKSSQANQPSSVKSA